MTDRTPPACRATLLERLQLALELELSTIPPYLVALLSIKRPRNREAADLIRGVAMEEMLHLSLVANVINALGGSPRIDRTAVPIYPLLMTFEGKAFADRRFPVDLARFSPGVIETFMKIEQPQMPIIAKDVLTAEITIPALTIGEFYQGLVTLMEELDREMPDTLFNGDPARQLEADYFWSGGGRILRVTDLATAKAALDTVITQGEGAWPRTTKAFAAVAGQALEMGHYYRFAQIHFQRHYVAGDDPGGRPSGAPLAVEYDTVFPIRKNAKASDYPPGTKAAALNDSFNRRYTMMLRQLAEAVNGEPRTLYTAIVNGMHGLTSLARQVMATPIEGDPGGDTACPTFEWLE